MKLSMLRSVLINLASLLLLLSLWMTYVSLLAGRVPPESALIINLILVPMMLGALGYFLIRGPFYVVVAIVAVLPIVHVFYYGGDPAKPGLERFIAVLEFLFLCLGLTAAYLIQRYFSSQ